MSRFKKTKNTVIGIPRSKLVKRSILDAVLKTHGNLSEDDRNFAINEIIDAKLDDQDLAKFIHQIYKLSNTGRFSLTYNLDLDSHIKAKIPIRIKELIQVSGDEKAWPELYDNNYLTEIDINVIEKMSNREYYAILNTIQTASSSKDFENIIPCVTTQDDAIYLEKDGIYHTSIYSKCYNNVCLSESQQTGKIISLTSDIPQIAYVAEGSDTDTNTDIGVYCFKIIDLIEQLSRGDYTNPNTGKIFSNRVLNQLLSKYDKEIKMYKKYLTILEKAGL